MAENLRAVWPTPSSSHSSDVWNQCHFIHVDLMNNIMHGVFVPVSVGKGGGLSVLRFTS